MLEAKLEVLCTPIVALPHALRRVMRLPEPSQDIRRADLRGIEDHLDLISQP